MKRYRVNYTKIIDRLAVRLRFINIKNRLIISFAVILLVPIISMSIYSLNYSSKRILSKVSYFTEIEMSQIGENIKNQIDLYKSDILTITTDAKFIRDFANLKDSDEVTKSKFINSLESTILKKQIEDKNVSSVAIITKEGKFVSGKGYDAGFADKIIKAADTNGGGISIKVMDTSFDTSKHKYEICFFRQIINMSSGDNVGYIWVTVDENSFYNIYKNNIKGNDGKLMILDSKGTVVSSNDKAEVGQVFKDSTLIKFATTLKPSASLKVANKDYFVSTSAVDTYDWFLVSMITNSYLNQEASTIRIYIIIIAIIIFLIAIVISFLISNSISSPLKTLMDSIDEAKKGRIKPSKNDRSKDEVGQVTRSFNEMMVTLSALIGNTKENSQNILNSIEAITGVTEQSFAASEQIASTMTEVANGSVAQADGMVSTVNYLNKLTDAINNVELSLKETYEVIENTEGMGKETKTAITFLEGKSKDTRNVVGKISTNISELNSYMNEIQAITKLISGVSEQTNLLSLNASIEAARVGDAGKGFTIVSGEVKKLAIQTNNASIKIASIISGLTKKITHITENATKSQTIIDKQDEAISETGDLVYSIIFSMDEVINGISDIVASINDIYRLKKETSNAIEGISAVSEETAAITEQVTATTNEQIADMEKLSEASATLNDMIVKLNNNMEMFKV